jgi:hypothetical protein
MTTTNNAIQTADKNDVVPGFFSAAAIAQLKTITNIFNNSSLVPDNYRGQANFGNCAIVLAMAARMNADPLLCLQNVYVVHGNPALSSKMMIALFNTCGRFGSIHYKETGKKGTDSQGVIAWAKELSTGDILEGPEVTIKVAKDEGWMSKNGTKWKTMPDQMLRYRAASWFIRTTAPELSVGLQTVEEAEDVAQPINITEAAKDTIAKEANTQSFEEVAEPKRLTEKDIEAAAASVETPEAVPVNAAAPEPAGPDF